MDSVLKWVSDQMQKQQTAQAEAARTDQLKHAIAEMAKAENGRHWC